MPWEIQIRMRLALRKQFNELIVQMNTTAIDSL